jgi:small conductance mechanosensitive channel
MDIDWAKFQETALAYELRILYALIILVVGYWVAKLIRMAVRGVMQRRKLDDTVVKFAGNLTYYILMAFVIVASLAKLGVQTASFVAIVGAAGLAIGLALQGSLSNFAAGVLLIIFRPFKAGDFVEVAGTTGSVDAIDIFTTVLTSPDNRRIIIPNAQVTGGKIVNFAAHDTRRVDMVVGVSYDADLDQTRRVLHETVVADQRVLAEPAPMIVVSELADSSVNFAVRPWVKTEDYWGVFFDLQEAIKKRLDAAEIGIPYPQTDVHLFQAS